MSMMSHPALQINLTCQWHVMTLNVISSYLSEMGCDKSSNVRH